MVYNPFKAADDEEEEKEKKVPNRGVTISSKPISEEIIRRFGKYSSYIAMFRRLNATIRTLSHQHH